MKKTLFLSLSFALLGALLPVRAQDVTIGDITALNGYIPTSCNYKNSVSQFIYTASEIGGPLTITSISFEHTIYEGYSTTAIDRSFHVYFTITSQSDYGTDEANLEWVPVASGDLVSTSGVTIPAVEATVTIPLDAPYSYSGTGNLAVTVVDNNTSYYGYHRFKGDNPTQNKRSLYKYSDNDAYSISSLPSPNGTSFRPQITLGTEAATNEVSINAPATAPAGTPVTFTAVGPASGTYVWTFTGATPEAAATQTATATWAEPGTYTVGLMAIVGGETQNLTHTITITDPNAVSIDAPASAPAGAPVTLTAVGPASGTYVWTLTGSTTPTVTGQTVSATWNDPGTYTVSLMAVVNGATQTVTHSITITDPNAVSIDAPASALAGDAVSFTALGPASGTYVWTFTGATPAAATGQTASATWNDPGTYTVGLMAVVNGQTQNLTHTITILDPNTVAIIAPASAAPNQPVTFTAQGPASGTYVWTFPGGNPAAAATQTATTTWAEQGTYTVSLMAVIEGETQNLTHTIVITTNGIDDASAAAFGLYPNPASDKVTVSLGEAVEVTLHDLAGRELLRLQLPAGQHTLDLTPYAAGTYFLRAGAAARKLVVK